MVSSNLKIFHSSLSPLQSFYPPDEISRKKQKEGNEDDFLSFLNKQFPIYFLFTDYQDSYWNVTAHTHTGSARTT